MWYNEEERKMVEEVFRAVRHNDLEKLITLIESGRVSTTISRGYEAKRKTLAHVAAKRGNLDILKYLVDQNPTILSDDLPVKLFGKKILLPIDPHTVLETAVAYGHLDVVKYLVEVHDVNILQERAYPSGSQSPVGLAISRGHLNILKYFIEERHLDVDTGESDKVPSDCYYTDGPLLFVAYKHKRRNITDYLIEEKKANMSVLDKKRQNILYHAVGKNDLNFIKYILDEKKADIDINWRDKDGKTLLYKAAEFKANQDIHIVQYLIEQKKADVDIPEKRNSQTPLHAAAQYTKYEILKLLVDHGSDLKKKDKDGATPLHLAVTKDFLWKDDDDKKCLYLLQHGANVTEKNNEGETPIDIILKTEKTKASKYLIDYVDDVDARNDKGETLLHNVATLNKIELLDYLVSKKHAKVDVARKEDEWTPLHCAAFWNHLAACKYLVEHGANPRAKDKAGRNPAQVASEKEVVNFFQNTSPKLRNRRSISPSTWVPTLQLRSHEHTLDQVFGHLNGRGNIITSVNETRPAFHFYNFLLLTNFFVQYLFFSARMLTDINNYEDIAHEYDLNTSILDYIFRAGVGMGQEET